MGLAKIAPGLFGGGRIERVRFREAFQEKCLETRERTEHGISKEVLDGRRGVRDHQTLGSRGEPLPATADPAYEKSRPLPPRVGTQQLDKPCHGVALIRAAPPVVVEVSGRSKVVAPWTALGAAWRGSQLRDSSFTRIRSNMMGRARRTLLTTVRQTGCLWRRKRWKKGRLRVPDVPETDQAPEFQVVFRGHR